MTVARQQAAQAQLRLFDESDTGPARHPEAGDAGSEAGAREAPQAVAARTEPRALPTFVMEEVADPANLNQAYKRVKANKGAAGVDGMPVGALRAWIAEHRDWLVTALLDGTYQPAAVRGVTLPKPGGGTRQLGIPTVVDRLVQQAIVQVLEPKLDPTFSASSYGFRPGRNAHQAVTAAGDHVAAGATTVVDLDLEKFFDRVNHDVLMARLARHVGDRRLLKLVRRFLQAGLLAQGCHTPRYEGTPQGGPLSPLMANLLLDDLDKELERRGHRFCRYADDCNIYVQSEAAGARVMASISAFLERRLRLRVNREKSAVAPVNRRQFLGYRLYRDGGLGISPDAYGRAKARLREITSRRRGVPLSHVIAEVNAFTAGWVRYFRHAHAQTALAALDQWLRRRLRCFRLKQAKTSSGLRRLLTHNGVPPPEARKLAGSGRGWWPLANTPQAARAMSQAWFDRHGLTALVALHKTVTTTDNRRGTRRVRPVV
jgi:RNA-directed DNA polymerase